MCGYFNEILHANEKWGGNSRRNEHMQGFQVVMDLCNLIDLGFVGPKFTWCNNREGEAGITERLDRYLANPTGDENA